MKHLPALACLVAATLPAQTPGRVDFRRDIQPLLREKCVGCHGPDQQMAGLRLDRRSSAMQIRGGTMIGPGNAVGSRLYWKVSGTKFGTQMPPTGPLSAEQIARIKSWIDQGAEWPDELSGDAASSQPDPKVLRIMDALRKGDRGAFRQLLRADHAVVNRKGPGGATPLMYAALYGDTESVRELLELGADPNLANDAGATALMWSLDDADKTRLLLERKADPNASSADGRSPLTIAFGIKGSAAVVKLLLAAGAKTTALRGMGADAEVLRALIDHGIDLKILAPGLSAALIAQCSACVDLLLPAAGKPVLTSALFAAARTEDANTLRMLLERGADAQTTNRAGGATPLFVAASQEGTTAESIALLLKHGAAVNAKTSEGATPLDFAFKQGNAPVIDLLKRSGAIGGATPGQVLPKPAPAQSERAALGRSIPLLQRSDVTFLKKSGCVSCHNNNLTAMTVAAARRRGIPVDEGIARSQLSGIGAYIEGNRERYLQGLPIAGGVDTTGYILLGLAAENYPPDPATDAMARYLKNSQRPDGSWRGPLGRPPLESSVIQVSATSIRALQVYSPASSRSAYDATVYDTTVKMAADWLAKAEPKTTEDRVFQILGLTWAGGRKEMIRKLGNDLLAQQRSDGGWSQAGTLASDSYATGQALVALKEAGVLAPRQAAYRRGVQFLMKTQLEDGSWYVPSRSVPFQPYFESDFPHGADQFISAAATNWAAMALIHATR